LLAIKEVTRKLNSKKILRVDFSEISFWGADPIIKPPVHRWFGGFVALVEIIAMRYNSTH